MAQPLRATQPVSVPLHLLSLNPNGMRDAAKRCQLFGQFLRGPWHVLCVQEAHSASLEELEAWAREGAGFGTPLRGGVVANPHTSRSAGVAVFWKEGGPVSAVQQLGAPEGGRLLSLSFSYAGQQLELVNCYAPNGAAERGTFFEQRLAGVLPAGPLQLWAGDWNCVEEAQDVVGAGDAAGRFGGSQQLGALRVQRGLVDAWRHLHPGQRGVTHMGTAGVSSARLDRWYVSVPLLPWLRGCELVHGLPGDHRGVELQLAPPNLLPCGKGRWRLPLRLLECEQYATAVRQAGEAFLAAHPLQDGVYTAGQRWEGLKSCLTFRSMAWDLHARHQAGQQRRQLRHAAHAAERQYLLHPALPQAAQAYRLAMQRLAEFEQEEASQRAAVATTLRHCYGEQPTKWFHHLGRKVMLHQPLPGVRNPAAPEEPPAAMHMPAGIEAAKHHATAFYSGASPQGLFCPQPADAAAQAALLAAVDQFLSPTGARNSLGPEESGTVTGGEVRGLFSKLPRGVSPGLDGLPYEFYIHFWDLLEEPFLAMAAASLAAAGEGAVEAQPDAPVLPPSMLRGLIVLIYKGGERDSQDLGSYRPITLLNCDYRLLARVLCARFAGPLSSVVDATQTAFLPGRWIGDNVLYHLEEAAYLAESEGAEGCVVLLDFDKAYDRVLRPWLYAVMDRMGFPEPAIRWVRLMLAGTQAQVSLNGHYTDPFPVLRSVQQGSPLSVLLYCIAAQPLAAHLRQAQAAGAWRPLLLPGGVPASPCHMHADDTSLRGQAPCDVAVPLAPQGSVGLYCAATNAVLSRDKCKGLCKGPHPELDPATRVCGVCGVTFPPPQEPIRHLGIFLSLDQEAAAAATWARRRSSMLHEALLWRSQQLSWFGRAYIAKQVLASKVCYHATFVPCPPAEWKRIEHLLASFVGRASLADGDGRGGVHHPAQHVLALPWAEGGISLVDLGIQADCLQAKVGARLLQPGSHPWKQLMCHRLQRALPTLGAAVLVSSLQVTGHHLTGRLLAYVRGFQLTLPHRVRRPGELTVRQVRAEQVYYNRQIQSGGQPLVPAQQPAAAAAGVLTVGRLADQVMGGQPLPPALQLVWDSVPEGWRQRAVQWPEPWPQWEHAAAAGLVRNADAGTLYSVEGNHRMLEMEGGAAAAPVGLAWEPCCVVFGAPEERGPNPPPVPFFLAPWREVQVDPGVWGHQESDLLRFTVKAAALRRVRLRALQREPRLYKVYEALRPRLWFPPPPGPDEAGPAVLRSGLEAMEARWLDSYNTLRAPGSRSRSAAEHEVPLLDCQRPGKRARLAVWERVAERLVAEAAAAAPGPAAQRAQRTDAVDPLGPPAAAAPQEAPRTWWRRLKDADLPREQHGTVYRIAQGGLYVGAFLCHIRVLAPQQACCAHAACEAQLETLTHAFVLCPAVAPAAAWVCAVFGAVAGVPPPPVSAAVLLAANPGAWAPPDGTEHVWTALRAAYLHAVWQLRCQRSLAALPFTPAAVCGAVVAALRGSIMRDWRRATQDLVGLSGACPEWFRGRSPALKVSDFAARWAHRNVLCQVQDVPQAQGGGRRLDLLLSLAHPVPAPLPPPPDMPPAAPQDGGLQQVVDPLPA